MTAPVSDQSVSAPSGLPDLTLIPYVYRKVESRHLNKSQYQNYFLKRNRDGRTLGTLAISVSPLHSKSVTESYQEPGHVWLEGRVNGQSLPWLQPWRPRNKGLPLLCCFLPGAAHSGRYGTCQNHPLLTPRGFLSGTPFLLHLRWDSVGEGLFSCFNNPLSTTKLPLVKISIIAYAILLALLETAFHPLNMIAALSQNSERV